jgi:hypothetical protein
LLQITNGRKWFLKKIRSRWLMETAFCWLKMLITQNGNKSQMTAFLCFFLLKEIYAKGSSDSLCTCPTTCYLQHVPKKKLHFRLSNFDRGVFFRAELVTWSVTLSFDDVHTKRITKLYSPRRGMQPAALPLTSLHVPCVHDQIHHLVSGERNVGGWEEFVNKWEKDKIRTNRNFVMVVDRVL